MGGAGIRYWKPIAEKYGINLTIINDAVDPTFSFMCVDHDGKVRMDCSSPYAMASLIGLKDDFDLAFGNDPDYDRHGIVTKSAGLMNPNHYLAVAINYLYTHRTGWRKDAAVGKTLVSSSMIDRVAASLGRNPAHREMSASEYASPDRPDCVASRLDVMVLSATEIDQEFNVNSITGTDGRILGALGGAPDTAEGARLTMVVLPTVRGIFQTLHRHVRTVCTPGSSVDVLVTERGICVNPARGDVQKALFDGGVDTTAVGELMGQVYDNEGEPDHGETGAMGSRTVAVVESRYGGILDTIHSAILDANG